MKMKDCVGGQPLSFLCSPNIFETSTLFQVSTCVLRGVGNSPPPGMPNAVGYPTGSGAIREKQEHVFPYCF